ncbi:phage head morphogenesis protein, partial [Acinetobacter baumannii]
RVLQELLAEQVDLITSIPREAGQRVHELTLKGLEDSTRASEIAKEIMRSGEVAKSRAMLIARTEVSRTATSLTQARAQFVGS